MHKNQLQELAQRSCFNLPSYSCIREGPDHAPRFKATVSFNGESFESPGFCSTLRQAEHAAAEVALSNLSKRGPGQSFATRIMDETGICKNLLQETAQRAGINLPVYSVERSGPGHMLVFTSTVELAGMTFTGESAKTKKQAEKNAATAAWASLKQLVQGDKLSDEGSLDASEEQLQKIIAGALKDGQKIRRSSLPVPKSRAEVPRAAVKQRVQITPVAELPERDLINGQKESHRQSSSPVPKAGAEVPKTAVKPRVQITPVSELPERILINGQMESYRQPSVPVLKSGAEVPRATVKQRVQLTPVSEHPEQALLNGQMGSHRQPSLPVRKYGNEVPRTTAKQRVQVTSSSELPDLEANVSQPSKDLYNVQKSVVSDLADTGSTNWSNEMVSQGPIQLYGTPMVLGSESHVVTMISSSQVPERFQAPTAFIVVNDQDLNLTTEVHRSFQSPYNPMMFVPVHQWIGAVPIPQANIMMGTFKTATSLASAVYIRQAMPVCSAPVIPRDVYFDDNRDATTNLEALNELKL